MRPSGNRPVTGPMKTALPLMLAALLVAPGCKEALGAFAGVDVSSAEAVTAPNPLRGAPIQFETQPRQTALQELRPNNCSIWPVMNSFTVQATAEEICVEAVLHEGFSNGLGPTRQSPTWSFVGDGGKAVAIVFKPGEQAQKIGTCTKKQANVSPETNAVWMKRVAGCVPNGGLLTEASTRLSVRESVPAGDYDLAAWTLK